MTTPTSIGECDDLLLLILWTYQAAIEEDRLVEAADLWVDLHNMLEVRLTLPQQRTSETAR